RRTGLAPQLGAANFQVINVHGQARHFSDGDCFLHFLDQLIALAADVAPVVAAVLRRDLRHREDLLGVVVAAAFVSCRQAGGAIEALSPRTSSVTPCRTALCAVPSTSRGMSECV